MDKVETNKNKQLYDSSMLSMGYELHVTTNSIIGFSQLLNIGANNLTKEQRECIEGITQEGKHLFEIVSVITDILKLQYGTLELTPEKIDLHWLLTHVFTTCSGSAFKRRIDLLLDLQPELGIIEADRARLERLLTNLVSNILRFTEQEHKVVIEAITNDKQAIIHIWNDSAPMTDEILNHLFLPYTREKHTFSSIFKSQGQGVGVFLAQKMVELHNGVLAIETSKRRNIFTIIIPRKK